MSSQTERRGLIGYLSQIFRAKVQKGDQTIESRLTALEEKVARLTSAIQQLQRLQGINQIDGKTE